MKRHLLLQETKTKLKLNLLWLQLHLNLGLIKSRKMPPIAALGDKYMWVTFQANENLIIFLKVLQYSLQFVLHLFGFGYIFN